MTSDQQHHIRNGSISIRRIVRLLLKCSENLSGNQKQLVEEMGRQAARIEGACNGDCKMPRKSWMTKTGAVLTTVGTIAGSAAQVMPLPAVARWMTFVAILAAGIGAALMGHGIRRRLLVKQEG